MYRPVAKRASLLYFCISDMASVDPMYQYSLPWFIQLFVRAMKSAEPAEQLHQRILNINNYFTYSLYINICRSLFEKHKLMFSLILCVKILQVIIFGLICVVFKCTLHSKLLLRNYYQTIILHLRNMNDPELFLLFLLFFVFL